MLNQGRSELAGGGVRYREAERRQVRERPAASLGETEELILAVSHGAHGHCEWSGFTALGQEGGAEQRGVSHPVRSRAEAGFATRKAVQGAEGWTVGTDLPTF